MPDTLHQLRQLPDLAAEAFATWGHPNPAERSERTGKRGKLDSPPTPADLSTLDALRTDDHGLLFRLVQCVQVVMDDTGRDDWPDTTWTSLTAWLVDNHVAWRADPFCEEWITDETRRVHAELCQLTRQPKPWRAKCRDCNGLVILADNDGTEVPPEHAAYGFCTGCERTYAKGASMQALANIQPPMPLHSIAVLTDIPVKTLHRWDSHGWITTTTPDRKRGRLFDIAEVRTVAANTRMTA